MYELIIEELQKFDKSTLRAIYYALKKLNCSNTDSDAKNKEDVNPTFVN